MENRTLRNAAPVILWMKLLLSARRSFSVFVGSETSISRMPFLTGDVRQRQVFCTTITQTNKGWKKEGKKAFLFSSFKWQI
jgi:hypothetical protein